MVKRIIVIGHRTSQYKEIKDFFVKNGMSEPLPSRRENMRVEELESSLLKSANAISCVNAQSHSELDQVDISSTWQGLMLDFLLANINQEKIWGWSSEESVQLLNTWLKVDQNTYFVFVYRDPISVLNDILISDDDQNVNKALDNWAAYYSALFNFYTKNSDRCCLVNSDVFFNEPIESVKKIPFLSTSSLLKNIVENCSDSIENSGENNKVCLLQENNKSIIANHLARKVTEKHLAHSVYEELKALSVNPLDVFRDSADEEVWVALKYEAVEELKKKQKELSALKDKVCEIEHSKKNLVLKNELLSTEIELLKNDVLNKAAQIDNIEKNHKKTANKLIDTRLVDENILLQIQVELLEDEITSGRATPSTSVLPLTTEKPVALGKYGAADRIKRQLTYRLGAVVVNTNTLADCITLPIRLKKEHASFNQELEKRKKESLPPISQYADADQAERVKQHLSYKLGVVVMKNTNSIYGVIKLPFLLMKESKKFKKEKK